MKELINVKKLEATQKPYYCSDINYLESPTIHNKNNEFISWEHFKNVWELDFTKKELLDFDLNLIFRYDLLYTDYSEEDLKEDEHLQNQWYLQLFIIHQRKGNFRPITIKNITKDDLKEINILLNQAQNKIKELWEF